MARGLIPTGMDTANQALTGLTQEARLGARREIAGKELELQVKKTKVESVQAASTYLVGVILAAITQGAAGGQQMKEGKQQLSQGTPQQQRQMDPGIRDSAQEGVTEAEVGATGTAGGTESGIAGGAGEMGAGAEGMGIAGMGGGGW